MIGGVAFGIGTSYTGIGIVGGGVIALHGLDNVQTGIRQAISGRETETFTHYALQASTEYYFNASPQTAGTVATWGDVALSFLAFNPTKAIASMGGIVDNAATSLMSRLLYGGGRLAPATGVVAQGGGALARAGVPGVGNTQALAAGLIRCANEVAGEVTATGQQHHAVSRQIERAAADNPNLQGVTRESGPIFQARDVEAHRGWQAWHRELDQTVVEHLADHPRITEEGFWRYLWRQYQTPDLQWRFPNQNWGPWAPQ